MVKENELIIKVFIKNIIQVRSTITTSSFHTYHDLKFSIWENMRRECNISGQMGHEIVMYSDGIP